MNFYTHFKSINQSNRTRTCKSLIVDMASAVFTKRNSIPLSADELKKCALKHTILKSQFDLLQLETPDEPIIHTNQHFAGVEILKRYSQNPHLLLCMALGYTQCGKTGVMLSCIKEFTNVDVTPVPVDNIFIITGLSSCEWKTQTQARLPECLKGNVLHRQDLKKALPERTAGKHNILILIDEVQVACGSKQSVSKILSDMGFMDFGFLSERDIKIVEFSATPNGTSLDSAKWDIHSEEVYIEPGVGYVGCKDLKEQGRILGCKHLSGPNALDSVIEISKCVSDHFPEPRYHFIRTKVGGTQDETIKIFKEVFPDGEMKKYDQSNPIDIDVLLEVKPEKHTFIFLKEMARCAKTFKKLHIGIWYERRAVQMMDDVVVQGLLGRATGYDDNGDSIIFSDMDSVDRYLDLFDSKFSKECPWNSNSTKSSSTGAISKGTFNGLVSDEETTIEREPVIEKFATQEEMIEFFKINIKDKMPAGKRGPNKKKISCGFYKASIRCSPTILHTERVYSERKWGLGEGPCSRSYPCYSNTSDPSTLEWWLIYYLE